ncbi:stage III sporulation protein AA [Allobacillus sp. GCM10007491]|uniref:Stage III sporulation protein AA n=1 Tax=Allobacillus saliphilus TaxID=2912308 RepID=A0A941HSW6_9BACI|nr:stage III sporulation protein AA [Allobacillus saliphilus]MBR7554186.1 stage III sporulation protein AA [Allobacillus saliphilus]
MEEIFNVLPPYIASKIKESVSEKDLKELEEIRLRVHRPTEVVLTSKSIVIRSIQLTQEESKRFLARISQHSVYRLEEELKKGFITLQGGHRIGLSGSVNVQDGSVKAISHVSSFNIRVAKAVIGSAQMISPLIMDNQSNVLNTLIVGPPKTGKTTILRDIIRQISDAENGFRHHRVGLIDERNEIAATLNGIPQHPVGNRTDVMSDCPKAEGILMMIRSMSPEVIVVDEIGHEKDTRGLLEAIYAGVKLICTVHGDSIEDVQKRPSIQTLIRERAIERFVFLDRLSTPGTVKSVYDHRFEEIKRDKRIRSVQHEMDRHAAHPVHVHVGRAR